MRCFFKYMMNLIILGNYPKILIKILIFLFIINY